MQNTLKYRDRPKRFDQTFHPTLANIAIGPLYRWLHLDNDIDYLYGYLACFDAISFGILAALLQNKVSRNVMRIWQVAAVVGLVVIYFSGIRGHVVFGFTGIALCTAILLIHIPPNQTPFWSYLTLPLRWMGRHSYELYLFHIIVLGVMRFYIPPSTILGNTKLLMFGIMVGTSCFVSFVVARWYATPINRWIRQRRVAQSSGTGS
ncbi:hypothetical protein [Halioxenophilus aromaticivorans]|uniref:hypothetical protein n=1 Tax=Halioxenophilus aromaticivorans TaxID=1306992 RepID=UPI0031E65376